MGKDSRCYHVTVVFSIGCPASILKQVQNKVGSSSTPAILKSLRFLGLSSFNLTSAYACLEA